MELPVLDAVESGEKPDRGERREPSPPTLIPGWRCVSPAIVRAGGEEGYIDLVALHPARGVALIALLDAGEEASPEEAHTAFRTMLDDAGFPLRFSGELPVLALAERRAEADQLAATVERRFAALPRPSLSADWVEWVAARLVPPVAAAPLPRLVAARDAPAAASAEEAPFARLVAVREDPAAVAAPPLFQLAVSAEDAPADSAAESAPADQSPAPRRGWLDRGGSLGFSLGLILAALIGLAVLTHAGRLF